MRLPALPPTEPDMHADVGMIPWLEAGGARPGGMRRPHPHRPRDGASVTERIASLHGEHILEYAEELGIGSRAYRLTVLEGRGERNRRTPPAKRRKPASQSAVVRNVACRTRLCVRRNRRAMHVWQNHVCRDAEQAFRRQRACAWTISSSVPNSGTGTFRRTRRQRGP